VLSDKELIKEMFARVEIIVPAGALGPSEYDTELDAVLREIAVAFAEEGEWAEKYGTNYEGKKFRFWRYYWGKCSCGFAEEVVEWWRTHSHDEDCFFWKAREFSEKWGIAWMVGKPRHEEYEAAEKAFLAEHGVSKYGWKAYCSCGLDDEYLEWRKVHNCHPDCPVVRPNFHWFGDDVVAELRVNYYKYISRGTEVSRDVTSEELRYILTECLKEKDFA